MAKILITGVAGFIGYHTAQRFLGRGDEVFGIDNLNDYYDVRLKFARLARLRQEPKFSFVQADLADRPALEAAWSRGCPETAINLAAQAGVRYSLENPHIYGSSNLTGFLNVLECARQWPIRHLVYASTSSVYGANTRMPFSEQDAANHQLTLYAATKKANEVMAHSYSYLFKIPTTGLRFFTVYGPWGRPDMALFLFTKAILEGRPIQLFNEGRMQRDFTYVDDIVEGIVRAADNPARENPMWDSDRPDPSTSSAPWRIFNIGNSQPAELLRYVEVLEEALGIRAKRDLLPMQAGDVPATWADMRALDIAVGYKPTTPIDVGVRRFVEWYRSFYGVPAS